MSEDLQEFIEKLPAEGEPLAKRARELQGVMTVGGAPSDHRAGTPPMLTQWASYGDGKFSATGASVLRMPAGIYRLEIGRHDELIWSQMHMQSDHLLVLPDMTMHRVMASVEQFWTAAERFHRYGFTYKRGVLLWGPPGGGKTATIMLLARELIQADGLVLMCQEPRVCLMAFDHLRRIEPARRMIAVLEDLDELIDRHGEAEWLSLMDGEHQIANVVYLATSNYPERLDPRFVNRPSRFDEIIKIGMPSAAARHVYFRSRLTEDDVSGQELLRWVEETDGLSIAHLRELVVAVFCLQRSYEETIDRLKVMKQLPTSTRAHPPGFLMGVDGR